MARIFLSHSSTDEREAVGLQRWLADNGWDDVFLDVDPERGLAAGERWQEALRKAADRCEAVVFIVSPAWAKSKWCLAEFLLAKSLHKQIFGVILKEVLLDELPKEMTSEWQLCQLTGPGPKETIKFHHRDAEHTVELLSDGLKRLKTGLQKAGLSADFFHWPPKDDPKRSPYRGLAPLDVADAAVFFGRDVEILRGLDVLRGLRDSPDKRLFVILGASGTGKSSFLRAGLLPRLARDDRHFLPLGVVRPETAPISGDRGLAQALHQTMKGLGLPANTPGDLKERLKAGPAEFAAILRTIQEAARARLVRSADEAAQPMPTLVLPIDQAEELFNADAGVEAHQFLALIAEILRTAREPVGSSATPVSLIVAFTIRSDRYEPLQIAPELAGLQTAVFDDLKPMPATRFREVITSPARRASVEIKPDLVDKLVEDCAMGADTLPLLSLTLERLYHDYGSDGDLRLDEYLALGGLGNIIKNKIESVLDRDSEKRKRQLALLRSAFIPWLVTINPQNDQPMRRVALRSDLPADSLSLVDALAENRLLTRDQRQDKTVIEVAHETLLRQWDVLAGWLQDERADLKEADALERQAREWKESGFNESWLWVGQRLKDALELAARPGFRERLLPCAEFLEKSRKQEEQRNAREVKKKQWLTTALFGTLIFAMGLGLAFMWALSERGRKEGALVQATNALASARQSALNTMNALTLAKRNAVLSQRQALVTEAGRVRDTRPVQSLLLASAAVEITRRHLADKTTVPSTHQALRDALASIVGRLLGGHTADVTHVAISHDGKLGAAASSAQPIVLHGHERPVHAVAFSPDSRRVFIGSGDSTVRLWDMTTTDPAFQALAPKAGDEGVVAMAFSSDNRRVAAATMDTVSLRDVTPDNSSAEPVALKSHEMPILTVAVSHDNHWLISGSVDRTARLWNLWETNRAVHQPIELKHKSSVNAVRFSPDGSRVVTGSGNTARVWSMNVDGPSPDFVELTGHKNRVSSVTISQDSRWVVTGSWDMTARVWDLWAVNPSADSIELKGHDGLVFAVAISQDNHWLVTGSEDKTARLWDLRAPSALPIVLKGHQEAVKAVAFSPDNRWVVTGSDDRTARLWLLQVEDLLVLARLTTGRNLSTNEWETFQPGQPYFEVFPGLPIPKN
jgi:WD40 repeat protein